MCPISLTVTCFTSWKNDLRLQLNENLFTNGFKMNFLLFREKAMCGLGSACQHGSHNCWETRHIKQMTATYVMPSRCSWAWVLLKKSIPQCKWRFCVVQPPIFLPLPWCALQILVIFGNEIKETQPHLSANSSTIASSSEANLLYWKQNVLFQ